MARAQSPHVHGRRMDTKSTDLAAGAPSVEDDTSLADRPSQAFSSGGKTLPKEAKDPHEAQEPNEDLELQERQAEYDVTDRLATHFNGESLAALESLGVHAYRESEIQSSILARATSGSMSGGGVAGEGETDEGNGLESEPRPAPQVVYRRPRIPVKAAFAEKVAKRKEAGQKRSAATEQARKPRRRKKSRLENKSTRQPRARGDSTSALSSTRARPRPQPARPIASSAASPAAARPPTSAFERTPITQAHCPACTYLNPVTATLCAVCGSSLRAFPQGMSASVDFEEDDVSDEQDREWVPGAGDRDGLADESEEERALDAQEERASAPVDIASLDDFEGRSRWGPSDRKAAPKSDSQTLQRVKKTRDDADDEVFYARLQEQDDMDDEGDEEDVVIQGGLVIPGSIWSRLFDHQQKAVAWLWELHQQQSGGIVADEMGLGKTLEVIAFLAALHRTRMVQEEEGREAADHAAGGNTTAAKRVLPTLILCPATVLVHWLREFHKWYRYIRVMLLHESGNHRAPREEILSTARRQGSVVVCTYQTFRLHQQDLLALRWGYVVLDEGHRIRNPDAQITLAVKQLRTAHRVILTGQPIQNSLQDLWSLFDFIYPGRLGTLPVFEEEFKIPIQIGRYKGASRRAVATGYARKLALKGLIRPYIMRRTKKTVAAHLPEKTEQVIFCSLTDEQAKVYRDYVKGPECRAAQQRRASLLGALTTLQKICNHPDLLKLLPVTTPADRRRGVRRAKSTRKVPPSNMVDYGATHRSVKLKVLKIFLEEWKKQGHKTLVFSQTRQVLDIVERLVSDELGISFLRVDGMTSVKNRQTLIDTFNTDPSVPVMLLTTRAGGIGINLTGASRVVIFDPHWNPSTDNQAKERSYRIGQDKKVTVYRLITKDTIEEKVYQRQIFKEHLTSAVLQNPKQKRFFSRTDLQDLFVCPPARSDSVHAQTEHIFAATGGHVRAAKEEVGASAEVSRQLAPDKREERPAVVVKKEEGKTADDEKDGDDSDLLSFVLSADNGWATSAFSHDKILKANDVFRASLEARSAAQQAVSRLQQSTRGQRIGQPTWTGVHGIPVGGVDSDGSAVGGAAGSAPAASDLLRRMRERGADIEAAAESQAPAAPPPRPPRERSYLEDEKYSLRMRVRIREFMRAYPKGVGTDDIKERFYPEVPSRADKTIFRALLQEECAMRRDRQGRGRWFKRKTKRISLDAELASREA